MILPLLLSMQSVAEAERGFAQAAQEQGQWTAFRALAAPDAVLYAPGPVKAQTLLAGKTNPPESIQWAPAHTLTACDATLAYSTGPWRRPDGAVGWFGTIWRKDAAGWRWIYDNGHDGSKPNAPLIEEKAACPGPAGTIAPATDEPGTRITAASLRTTALASLIEASDGPMPVSFVLAAPDAEGGSVDRTLIWRTNPIPGGKPGAHLLRFWSWDGRRYRLAVLDYSVGG